MVELIGMLKRGIESAQTMEFADRRVNVFEGGFVQQHTLYVNRENGFRGKMKVCFVAYTNNGRFSRIYEYFDTGQIEGFLGPRERA